MKRISIKTIFLLLLVVAAVVLWLLIRPPGEEVVNTQEEPSGEFEIGGRFSEVCPPGVLPSNEQLIRYYSGQIIDETLWQHFYQVKEVDGQFSIKVENRAFCLFSVGGTAFGMLNTDYVGPSGKSAVASLETWMSSRGINSQTICEIFWVEVVNPCKEGPETPEKEGDRTLA